MAKAEALTGLRDSSPRPRETKSEALSAVRLLLAH